MRTDNNHTVAYFYCLRDTKQPKKEDPDEILRAILKQLVILLPSRLSAPVRRKYEEEKRKGGDHGSIRSLTFEESARFIMKLATSRPVTIIIDALDECRENKRRSSQGSQTDRRDLLKELLAANHDSVRVFLSSRDDIDILRRLQRYPTITLNASKNGSDILNFIKSEVDDLMAERVDWGHDETLRDDIITTVSDRANGMSVLVPCILACVSNFSHRFRFAALQIGYLSCLDTRNSVRRRLRHLPTTLRELYDKIYGRISAKVEEESSIAKRTLSWLLCARRQLRPSELLAAVSPDPDQPVNEDELLRLCRHLVVLNPVSKSFELAHLTVREYLETRHEYRKHRPHALVAERCIKVFDGDVSQGLLDQYASLYWADHYNGELQTEENPLADLLEKFFHNKGVNPVFEKWAKFAKDSSKTLPWGDNVARRLRDAWYRPLGVVSVFGFAEAVHQWTDAAPGYSYFSDSDDAVVHLAIKWGNKGVVRMFLKQDTPTIDKFGWTSWVWAAVYEQLPVLEVLKDLYGDVNAQDAVGWTALHWMVFLGHIEGLKVLLSVGAGPNMTDEAKWTPLHWAAFLGRDAEAREIAVGERGLDVKDCDGLTPLQWAKIVGHDLTTKHRWTGDSGQPLSKSYAPVRMDCEFSSSNPTLTYLNVEGTLSQERSP
jgi:Ankyrin repeats (3 copies)